jgi:glycosyltransferase involved in cell wall biosynthesis
VSTQSDEHDTTTKPQKPQKPQRILHLLGSFKLPQNPDQVAVSGVVRVALELARLQAEAGHDVMVVCVGPETWQSQWCGVTLRSFQPLRWARVLGVDLSHHLPFVLLTLRKKFDVVHGHLYYYMRGLRAGIRMANVHGDPLHKGMGEHAIGMDAETFALLERTVDGFIAVSQFVAERLRTGLSASANVKVVYNGVNLKHFEFAPEKRAQVRTHWRKQWQVDESATVFVFVGAIVPEKGVMQLARAFANVEVAREDVHLVVIGSSSLWGTSQQTHDPHAHYEAEIYKTLEPASTRGHVHVMGKVSSQQVAEMLLASDVATVPSLWQEPFGLVILEAFAAGLPVIASHVGGIPEVAVYGFHRLIPADDEDAIDVALEQAAQQPQVQQPHWNAPLPLASITASVSESRETECADKTDADRVDADRVDADRVDAVAVHHLDVARQHIQRVFSWEQCFHKIMATYDSTRANKYYRGEVK